MSKETLMDALQGLVTQWKALGDEMERNNRDAWADEIRIYGACANELSAILAGVPEPPTKDDELTRMDSLTPIETPQPAPTNERGWTDEAIKLLREPWDSDARKIGVATSLPAGLIVALSTPHPPCILPPNAVFTYKPLKDKPVVIARTLDTEGRRVTNFIQLEVSAGLNGVEIAKKIAAALEALRAIAGSGPLGGAWCVATAKLALGELESDPARILKSDGSQATGSATNPSLGVPEGVAPGAPDEILQSVETWIDSMRHTFQSQMRHSDLWTDTERTDHAQFMEAHDRALSKLRALVPLPGAAASDVHQQIMNIQPMRSYLGVPGEEDMRHAYLLGHRDARHDAAELVAALPSPPDGWQPIETALKGERLLLWRNDWDDYELLTFDGVEDWLEGNEPTHWMKPFSTPTPAPKGRAMILYTYALFEEDGTFAIGPPCLAWDTAEAARSAAVSFVADRYVREAEADELMEWVEHIERQDGKYPIFIAPTKYRREVRVWPMEVVTKGTEPMPKPGNLPRDAP